jgi:hypothetical protein
MPILDKTGTIPRLRSATSATIELGCGRNKQRSDAIGIDTLDYPGVDIVGDALEVLSAFPDACVAGCYSSHFFEHVPYLGALMKELGRVFAPGGQLQVVVPHFSNPYFYSDYTHVRPFGLYSFSYLCRDQIFKRRVPSYQHDQAFALTDARLVFRTEHAPGVRALERVANRLFNANRSMTELYEQRLCWLLPCYELRFSMVRLDDGSAA